VGEWSDPSRVTEYLSREIPHRQTAERMLLEALPPQVGRVLDLGTGDGRLLALVRNEHPGAWCVGVDSSEPMLELARSRFAEEEGVELLLHDLSESLSLGAHPRLGAPPGLGAHPGLGAPPAEGAPQAIDGRFDVVISGLAIHHLEDHRKRALFGEIYELLQVGGVFANLDLVASPSAAEHERFRCEIGRIEDDPSDLLASLGDQLDWLREVGFLPVGCQFKWLELALVIAGKPSSAQSVHI
jgi:tRNA (cmo5U34)-methyltransferase